MKKKIITAVLVLIAIYGVMYLFTPDQVNWVASKLLFLRTS